MIQRKQSVYLLLGALSLSAIFFLDGGFDPQATASLSWYVPALVATGAVTVILAVVAIFLYDNRPLQKKVVVGVQVLDLAFLILLVAGMLLTDTLEFSAGDPNGLGRMLVLLLPIVAYVFFYLARRGIQADIDLVRSMDRLR
jgi:hypothetical protein